MPALRSERHSKRLSLVAVLMHAGFVEKDSPQLMAAIAEFMSKSPREKRVYKERYVEPFEITDDTHPAKIEHYQLNWLDREQERGVRVPWVIPLTPCQLLRNLR